MTKLIVTPIDPAAPGSYLERKALFHAVNLAKRAIDKQDNFAVAEAYEALDAVIVPRLRTDDGTSVDNILATLSMVEFDQLLTAVTSGESVSPPNASSSTVPPVPSVTA